VQTYRKSLADSGATLLLSPDADFLRLLVAGPATSLLSDAPKCRARRRSLMSAISADRGERATMDSATRVIPANAAIVCTHRL